MGLDMYLYARRTTYNGYEKDTIKLYPQELQKFLIGKAGLVSGFSRERTDDYKIGYWRKANAIHRYFVDNCAEGVDERQIIRVDEDHIDDLLEKCTEVLADHNKASVFLPTTDGFFFGGTDYDEYYFDAIQRTVEILSTAKAVLTLNDNADQTKHERWKIVYCASW